jgi:hypothetical protein
MRREHPAFRMTTAELINKNVTLDPASTDEVVIININGEAVNDEWGTIKVVMNSKDTEVEVAGVAEMTKVADGKDVGNVTQNSKAAPRAVSIWITENANYCGATQRFNSLYLVGSFSASNWTTFIEMERHCEGNFAWWQTKEPVSLSPGTEFLFLEEANNWSTKIGYSSSNDTESSCYAGSLDAVLSGAVAIDCHIFNLTKGENTDNIVPDSWTSGVSLDGDYKIELHESDLAMKMWKKLQQ